MTTTQSLSDQYDILSKFKVLGNDIPTCITDNLNLDFPLRPYQKEALHRFIYYIDHPESLQQQTTAWLLFQMATGSGKTLIMAAQILYLYAKGYRNFIFFVNSANVIEKTRDNFLNKESKKYLFAKEIKFNERQVKINEVDGFQGTNNDNINILFTTIQKLHSDLNFPRENSITFEDFKEMDIVMLSDEAHHINSLTKKHLNKDDQGNISSWEHTVTRIAKSNNSNVLLEFTATIDMDNDDIRKKYYDKLIYEYSLKEFRQDGYSKEVNILQSDTEVNDRVLKALLLSQYRKKIAERHGIWLKPIVLLKSKTIQESKKFENEFYYYIKNMTSEDLSQILNVQSLPSVLKKVKDFLAKQSISYDNFIKELKEEFSPERCISVNSKEDMESKQLSVNSLELKENPIRLIFAVNMLNEGWDVLNLYDIVRLYDTRDAKAGVPGQTTIAEAQLIGRGARYFPFSVNSFDDKYKRKYDDDVDNEMKILEDFYYHSKTDSRYIQELKKALIHTGIMPDSVKCIKVRVKDSFKNTDFWKEGVIFTNARIPNNAKETLNLAELSIQHIFKYKFFTGHITNIEIFEEQKDDDNSLQSRSYKFSEIPLEIVLKALSKLDFYHFDNLQSFFPSLKSTREFILDDKFLKNFIIEIQGSHDQINNISRTQLLEATVSALKDLSASITRSGTDFIGSTNFTPSNIKDTVKDKTLNIAIDESTSQERGRSMKDTPNVEMNLDLSKKDWYIYNDNYGTSEEKFFIKFLDGAIERLRKKFTDIYLLRNEKLFQIFSFSDGTAFEPDFVLFLKENQTADFKYFQLFIEPKGGQLLEHDKWKEEFLRLIHQKYKLGETLYSNENYKLIGLPFFNENKKVEFITEFENSLGLDGSKTV